MSIDVSPRCPCGKLLAIAVTQPWAIMCPRCKRNNTGAERK